MILAPTAQKSADAKPRTRQLYERNAWKSRSSAQKSFEAGHLYLSSQETRRTRYEGLPSDEEYRHHSHATSFARGGIRPGLGLQGAYDRDPLSGAWHRHPPEGAHRKIYMRSSSPQTMRYKDTHSPHKAGPHGTTIWASSFPPGSFWVQPSGPPSSQRPSTVAMAHSVSEPLLGTRPHSRV